MDEQQRINLQKENAINSYEELMTAVSEASNGSVKFVKQEKGVLIMQLSKGFKVEVYEDNHTVNLGFKYGNILKMIYCDNYNVAFETILNAERGLIKFQEPLYMRTGGKILIRIAGIVVFSLGMLLFLVGGFLQIATLYGAITAGFKPFHIHITLILCFFVALFGASALMYLGFKLIKRKIFAKNDIIEN